MSRWFADIDELTRCADANDPRKQKDRDAEKDASSGR